jgi:hypothetical protein|tara:strand:+ start:1312 stop:1476 length:165 start_codon:yes stop_codon:yes gene_type:complete
MAKMSKAQQKKRLKEAKAKVKAVYISETSAPVVITTQDMAAIEKIIDKCLKRLS